MGGVGELGEGALAYVRELSRMAANLSSVLYCHCIACVLAISKQLGIFLFSSVWVDFKGKELEFFKLKSHFRMTT